MKRTMLFLILLALGLGSQTTFAVPPAGGGAPDSGSTMLLLGMGVTGLAWVTKRLRR